MPDGEVLNAFDRPVYWKNRTTTGPRYGAMLRLSEGAPFPGGRPGESVVPYGEILSGAAREASAMWGKACASRTKRMTQRDMDFLVPAGPGWGGDVSGLRLTLLYASGHCTPWVIHPWCAGEWRGARAVEGARLESV